MIEVRHSELEILRLRRRLGIAWMFVLVCFALLGGRFAYLQVISHSGYYAQAEANRTALVPVSPPRGLIYDRNGIALAANEPVYLLELTPDKVENVEQTIEALSEVVEITPRDRRRFQRLREESHSYEPILLRSRLTDIELARFAVERYRFPGVSLRPTMSRSYPMGEIAAHLIGYIGRISPEDKARIKEDELQSIYAGSTHIGKTGIELTYEAELHGMPGAEAIEVSSTGRAIRSLSQSAPVPGRNLQLSIDVGLQQLAEEWFGDKKGALVAIDPRNGEVLAMVSRPSFDPSLFVDGIDPQSWKRLNEDPDKPLLNRPLRGTYPPGSTYKPFMALAALSLGLRKPETTISDPGYFQLGNHRFRDSQPAGHGTVNLQKSIVVSSDTYYYKLAYDMGVDAIHDFMLPWGFGQLTGIDLRGEATGVLPSSRWKFRRFRQKWLPGESPSIGIGQGYNAFTILQLAHATATLANDGQGYVPKLLSAIIDPATKVRTPVPPTPTERIALRPEHLRLVRSAMVEVNRVGTSRMAFSGAGYVAAGKTGTAQVIGIRQNERYDAKRIAERFRDHSLFIGFAPANAPTIALAVIVENGGFGAQAAAPIARRVFDYHLLGEGGLDTEGVSLQPMIAPDAAAELRDIPEFAQPETVDPQSAPPGEKAP